MIRKPGLIAGAAIALLAGCASTPDVAPPSVMHTVEVPTPVRCRPDLGPEPDYPDTDEALRAAPDLFSRVRLLLAGRMLRIARDQQKTAALAACAG
ncbi:hypothetical protein [Phenylobacterium montanum]|uniref:Uncharacterized protein n=1 Tax=Phenylobacterium montanum TaxID=2823693 RepID=A0A975IV06_9CAUL|nr:hypothetical protein [Caulobacter sp. S6]QUD88064.1 hypothetical protein KCG34_24035 [Caulobacter sp. S6]